MMNFGFGQEDCRFIFNSNESYLNIQEGVIKNELSIFIKKASNSQKNSINIRLNNVKLKKCSDSFVFFEKGNIYESELIISIESKNNGKSILVREVFFSHYKFGFSLPDSVINDIHAPVFCTEYTKRGKPIASNCKVYQSEDKRRVYIYMLNDQGKNSYEVTWIIQDDKYYSRVIDVVN
ncbi:MAG: hypothetical protein RBR87_12050 [Bacteroidales bacterium]|jgi:hypothetical protein|nr:hypothetical protein [Bacteroidales bacterium]